MEWTTQWIKDHAEAARRVGKPVVHEEYGESFPFSLGMFEVSRFLLPFPARWTVSAINIIIRPINRSARDEKPVL